MELDRLPAGHRLPTTEHRITRGMVLGYLDAVGDQAPVYRDGRWVPPTAVAALTVKVLLEGMGLPPGTLHASQDIEMSRPLAADSDVLCEVRVAQNAVRQQWRFLVLDVMAREKGGPPVMQSRCTLLVPAGERQP